MAPVPSSRHMREVLVGLLHGLTEQQIAAWLKVGPDVVHADALALYAHYGVRGREQLLDLWLDPAGPAPPPPCTTA